MSIGGQRGRFPALKQTEFRLYWLGMLGYSFGMQARGVIVGWLIYQLTGSALSLGWYISTWGAGALIFSLIGGGLSDRIGPRPVVIGFRFLSASILLILAGLAYTDMLVFWHLLVFNFINGAVSSFEYPARSSLLTDLIPKAHLTRGFGVSYTAMNIASIVGPAAMGWVTDALGPNPALLITGLVVLSSSLVILPIKAGGAEEQPEGVAQPSMSLKSVGEGLRHILSDPGLLAMESLLLLYVVVLIPYRDIMPVVAADVLQVGASGLGLLSSALSVGALMGTLLISAVGEMRPRGAFLLGAAALHALGALAFSQSQVFLLSVATLAVAGMGQGIFVPLNNTLLQARAQQGMRARSVGINMMVWSLGPIGSIMISGLADRVGPGGATFTAASLALLGVGLFALFVPRLRRLD